MHKNPLKIQHMTAADWREAAVDKVILPLGSMESHGDHLPFGTDTLTAYKLALEVAQRVPGTAVLPPLTYGMSEHYRDFPLTVSLSYQTETALIGDILESVYREGLCRILLLNGHDGNIAPIEVAARSAKVAHPDFKIATLEAWWAKLGPLLPPGFFEVWNGLGHGGEAELSIGLALFPELCQPEKARGMVPELPDFLEMKWLFKELTDSGASGDPTWGTAEKGASMREILVEAIAQGLRQLDAVDWDIRTRERRESEGP
jgi:creatinine amidohydrolase